MNRNVIVFLTLLISTTTFINSKAQQKNATKDNLASIANKQENILTHEIIKQHVISVKRVMRETTLTIVQKEERLWSLRNRTLGEISRVLTPEQLERLTNFRNRFVNGPQGSGSSIKISGNRKSYKTVQ